MEQVSECIYTVHTSCAPWILVYCVHSFIHFRWLAAYAAAASFRYSHYFVSLLSQFGALIPGIGRTATDKWCVH